MSNSKYIYVFGDGDKIRERIEYNLLNGRMEDLSKLSQGIADAVQEIKARVVTGMDAEVVMSAGDDILFRLERGKYQKEEIQQLSDIFYRLSGCTMSFGIGESVEEAYINLRRAKSSRGTRIVEGKHE